jgi:hypothetical protein
LVHRVVVCKAHFCNGSCIHRLHEVSKQFNYFLSILFVENSNSFLTLVINLAISLLQELFINNGYYWRAAHLFDKSLFATRSFIKRVLHSGETINHWTKDCQVRNLNSLSLFSDVAEHDLGEPTPNHLVKSKCFALATLQ